MTYIKKIAQMFVIVAVLLTSQGILCEANESTDIVVSYSPSEDALRDIYVEVEIQGEGQVYDNGINVKNHTRYELKYGNTKTFLLEPSSGYRLASVQYDGKDITSKVNNNSISISCLEHDTKLTITFEKADGAIEGEKPSHGGIDTGTSSMHTGFYIALMLLAGASIVLLLRRRKTAHKGGDSYDGV